MTKPKFTVTVTRLAGEEDWLGCRERVEAFEGECPLSPWSNWEYNHELWRTYTPDKVCHLLEARRKGEDAPLAMSFWRQHTLANRFLKPLAARSFDHVFFMRIPAFLARRGCPQEAARAMAEGMAPLAASSKADMGTLLRIDRATGLAWTDELRRRGVFVKKLVYCEAQQVVLADEADGFFESRFKKFSSDIRRQNRRIAKQHGAEPEMVKVVANALSDEAFNRILDRCEDIRKRTWQYQWEEDSEQVDHAFTAAFNRRAFGIWRRKGLVEFFFLKVGNRDVAYWVALLDEDRVWGILTGYDPDWRKFGVGKTLIVAVLEEYRNRGFRLLELGGEGVGWKRDWATRNEPIYQIEWPLGTWKSRLWVQKQRLRALLGKSDKEPVKSE